MNNDNADVENHPEKIQCEIPYYPVDAEIDFSSPGGPARYLAHLELEPIEGLIDYSEKAEEYYMNLMSDKFDKSLLANDLFAGSQFLDEREVFSTRIVPLAYDAILIMMMSIFEESFNAWCRIVYLFKKNQGVDIVDFKEYIPQKKKAQGLDKAIDYLKKYGGIDNIKQDKEWGFIDAIRTARNMLVHNGGRVKVSERNKINAYGIGMNDEDYSLYIDHDTIKKMYKSIIGFVDRVMV